MDIYLNELVKEVNLADFVSKNQIYNFSNTDYLYNIYEKYNLCFNRTNVLNQRYAGKVYNSNNIDSLNLTDINFYCHCYNYNDISINMLTPVINIINNSKDLTLYLTSDFFNNTDYYMFVQNQQNYVKYSVWWENNTVHLSNNNCRRYYKVNFSDIETVFAYEASFNQQLNQKYTDKVYSGTNITQLNLTDIDNIRNCNNDTNITHNITVYLLESMVNVINEYDNMTLYLTSDFFTNTDHYMLVHNNKYFVNYSLWYEDLVHFNNNNCQTVHTLDICNLEELFQLENSFHNLINKTI